MSDKQPEVLTLSEAAAYLRISEKQARRMATEGRLPHFRTGTGKKARIRVYLWALRRAAQDNFAPTSNPEAAASVKADIRELFGRRKKR